MSAKVCDSCAEQIVFGRDIETGKLVPLDNFLAVYQIVEGEKIRFLPNGFRARHRCSRRPVLAQEPDRDFSEPRNEE